MGWAYFKRWLRTAVFRALGGADLVSGLAATALGAINHFVPPDRAFMSGQEWLIPFWALGAVFAVRLVLAPYWMASEDKKKTDELESKLGRIADKQGAVDRLSALLSEAIHDIWNAEINTDAELAALDTRWDEWQHQVEDVIRDKLTYSDLIHFARLGVVPLVGKGGTYNDAHAKILREYALKEARLRDIIRDHKVTRL